MRISQLLIISIIALSIVGCQSKSKETSNNTANNFVQIEGVANDSIEILRNVRDTLIGRFNGIDIDTLISEPLDKRGFPRRNENWRVYSKKGTVKDLIITNTVSCMLRYEGDLDLNGIEEFGIDHFKDGEWFDYPVYTYDNGEWKYIYDPTNLNSNNYAVERWKTMDSIVESTGRKGEIHLRVAGWDFEYSTPVDTVVKVEFYPLIQKDGVSIDNLYQYIEEKSDRMFGKP
ncbi:MAG: hypothetical protein J1F67_00045 [Muribaculaceae bacterium]|nr:hypothetical protein [Muribaculaceae bacterium]